MNITSHIPKGIRNVGLTPHQCDFRHATGDIDFIIDNLSTVVADRNLDIWVNTETTLDLGGS